MAGGFIDLVYGVYFICNSLTLIMFIAINFLKITIIFSVKAFGAIPNFSLTQSAAAKVYRNLEGSYN